MWVATLLKLLAGLGLELAKYASNKQLIDAGEAKAMLEGFQNVQDAVNRAKSARAAPDSVLLKDDPNSRRNKK